MYLPMHNQVEDQHQIFEMIKTHSFGILITSQDDLPFATHLPFVLEEQRGSTGTLISHMARANPQWRHFTEKSVLVVFQGAHTYVSPTWYRSEFNVPTWNYVIVHAYGIARIVEEMTDVTNRLDQLVAQYEGDGTDAWSVPWKDDRYGKLTGGVVTFEIEISKLEGKWKISQNKSQADQQGVIEHLQQMTSSPDAVDMAAMMCQHLKQVETKDNV